MYQKGDLRIRSKNIVDDYRNITDSRVDGYPDVPAGHVYLPHSCDEWVIGGREQIEALMSDLEAALQQGGEES